MSARTTQNSFKKFNFPQKRLSIAIALVFNPLLTQAQFPANLDLATLNGSNGIVIQGETSRDFSGFSVSSAGDFNGDGFDDVIVGAYQADVNSTGGISYVVFGNSTGLVSPLSVSDIDGTNGLVILGETTRDRLGYSVSAAGDVNDDGLVDIIIGAPRKQIGSQLQAGSAYVIFGSTQNFSSPLNVSTLTGANGFILLGENQQDFCGASVSAAGDINGDLIDDIIIGAPRADPNSKNLAGKSYVVFGKTSFGSSINLSNLTGGDGFAIQGASATGYSGTSVSAAGDFNDDGIDDVIIGALGVNSNGGTFAGRSYVVFGKTSAFSPTLNLSGINNSKGYVFKGVNAFDATGSSVSGIGDINGDGIDDILMGAPGNPSNGAAQTGIGFVVFGTTTVLTNPTELSDLNGSNGFVIEGINTDDSFGGSVNSAGDINGDGNADIIIGATGASFNGTLNAGSSYVVLGKNTAFSTTLNVSNLDGSNGFAIHGASNGDRSGISVHQAGDFNADGVNDLIIGAKNANPGAKTDAGSSYIVFGQKKDEMFADGFE